MRRKARIEIIPLIDVMFFLLAAFILISLSMVRLRSLRMNLPTPAVATASSIRPDLVRVEIDRSGEVTIDKKRYSPEDLRMFLTERMQSSSNVAVYIKGDFQATHGMVTDLYDRVKSVGVEKVSMNIGVDEQVK